MKRLLIAMIFATVGLTACGGDDDGSGQTVNASADSCKESTARELRQNFITNSKFDVECVKATAGSTFFFVNNDETTHTVTTQQGAPEMFDAELPQKNSTYSHKFEAKGKYTIECKRHSERMTLFIV